MIIRYGVQRWAPYLSPVRYGAQARTYPGQQLMRGKGLDRTPVRVIGPRTPVSVRLCIRSPGCIAPRQDQQASMAVITNLPALATSGVWEKDPHSRLACYDELARVNRLRYGMARGNSHADASEHHEHVRQAGRQAHQPAPDSQAGGCGQGQDRQVTTLDHQAPGHWVPGPMNPPCVRLPGTVWRMIIFHRGRSTSAPPPCIPTHPRCMEVGPFVVSTPISGNIPFKIMHTSGMVSMLDASTTHAPGARAPGRPHAYARSCIYGMVACERVCQSRRRTRPRPASIDARRWPGARRQARGILAAGARR